MTQSQAGRHSSIGPIKERINHNIVGNTVDSIVVRGLRLWAHVGVLEHERALGQWFELDVELAHDLAVAGRSDGLADTLDYSRLILDLQAQARTIRCQTLEHYSEQILDLAQNLYGPVPIKLELRKCSAPVPGFGGVVAVKRQRHGPIGSAAPDELK